MKIEFLVDEGMRHPLADTAELIAHPEPPAAPCAPAMGP